MLDYAAPLAEPLVPAADDVAMARRAERTYRAGPQLIMPYLYLGGAGNVAGEQLQALEITHVLNVAREVSGPCPASTAYRHCMWDHNEPDLVRYFAECFAFIDSARTRHQGVLVHCQLGVSRSASLVIAYVMRTMAMAFGPAYEYVRLRAPCISPNLSLIAQLSEYGELLAKSRRPLGPELLLLMPDATLPELTADESSAAGSENSSPVEVLDDGGLAPDEVVDLMTMPIKQLPQASIVASNATIRQSPGRLHVVAHRHFLVP
ncbi:tyrosine/serine/threonine protein phosphatase [Coemansia sp. S2]|nr:tyrosine/serine/threonine protein phosphatase [Coemansia sp. S2]KAJ2352786.1 tyrosine/serine/threonine protein phosphatase [Coemansia sp. RSA 2673]